MPEAGVEAVGQFFTPVSQLYRTDAQVTLLFLANNNVKYVEPVEDPWLRADLPYVESLLVEDGVYENFTFYTPREPVSVLGCTESWQWCNPNLNDTDGSEGLCTDFTWPLGSYELANETLGISAEQKELLYRLSNMFWDYMFYNTVSQVGSLALLANQLIAGGSGAGLPDDQWVREVDHFAGIMMTSAQLQCVGYVRGLGYPTPGQHLDPIEPAAKWMCDNQMVEREDFSSFNMLGVLMILCFGAVFFLVNLLQDTITNHFLYYSGKEPWSGEEWKSNNLLHIQSLAYEESGVGHWDRESAIPTTERGEKLRPLSMSVGSEVGVSKTSSKLSDSNTDTASKRHSPQEVHVLEQLLPPLDFDTSKEGFQTHDISDEVQAVQPPETGYHASETCLMGNIRRKPVPSPQVT